ncbi:MAG: DEAD/DEAH box helicase family protein [Bacilli bacterium]|nr:DEAD/DEAH box helicase family protein [Bacilli bacterium]
MSENGKIEQNQTLELDGDIDLDIFEESPLDDEVGGRFSAKDAVLSCLNDRGRIDLEFMSKKTGIDKDSLIKELEGLIFRDPAKWGEDLYKGFVTADEYLSGNLAIKYQQAVEASIQYKDLFDPNVKALREILPPFIDIDDIYVNLGTPWIPTSVVETFVENILGYRLAYYGQPKRKQMISRDPLTGTWKFNSKSELAANCSYTHVNETYGTPDINAIKIIEKLLNNSPIEVKKKVGYVDPKDHKRKEKKITDTDKTLIALQRAEKIRNKFREYITANKQIAKQLQTIYFETIAAHKTRKFDGSYLELPGLNKDVHPFSFQKDAAARIILTPNTLLAHDVGAGKTYIMIMAAHELHRLGISKKNLFVVPNSILEQWKKDYLKLYPNADLLYVKTNMFTPSKKKATLDLLAYGEYEAILMPYSVFSRIEMSPQHKINELEKEKWDLTKSFQSGPDNAERRKQYMKKHQELEEEIGKLVLKCQESDAIFFDDLKVNTLFVDEAHNFKNVPFKTNVGYMPGLNPTGSPKCQDMMDKVKCVQRQNGGRGVVFATGTPITNSISDIYIMQKYLQDGVLQASKILDFDDWIGNFAEMESGFEVDVDVTKYRVSRRFNKFHNIPELTTMLSLFADFHEPNNADELPSKGEYEDVIIERSETLRGYLKLLSKRADDIRESKVMCSEDNMLKITTDGRKAALDLRLVGEHERDINAMKVVRCADRVAEIYRQYNDKKSTQLVFCDISTPSEKWNVYEELLQLLLHRGIPREEIAFIYDAENEKEKEELFEDIRTSKIRVFVGSTWKMGLGVNVQNHLIALHHLDVPWRPSDLEQREGRILRTGNENEKVHIIRYITKGSFDSYSWQLLEIKQRFIDAFLSNSISERHAQEMSDNVLNYSEVKALACGTPAIKNRLDTKNQIDKYKKLQEESVHKRGEYATLMNATLPAQIRRLSLQKKQLAGFVVNYEVCYQNKIAIYARQAVWPIIASFVITGPVEGANYSMEYYETDDYSIRQSLSDDGQCLELTFTLNKMFGNDVSWCSTPMTVTFKKDEFMPMAKLKKFLSNDFGLKKKFNAVKEEYAKAERRLNDVKNEVSAIEDYTVKIAELEAQLRVIDAELRIKI